MSLENKISQWIKDYCEANNFKCVIGVSGGIDSALVSTLCAMTGIETHLITMPILQKPEQLDLAHAHMKSLSDRFSNVKCYDKDLTQTFLSLKNCLSEFDNDLGWANSRSRLRMITLYQLATHVGGLVIGTGNKVEDFGVGFFTKYGDGGVDLSPIADLSKTEVRKLAKDVGVIESILKAKPTDGLWDDDRNDEEQIGASYEELEWAMSYAGDLDTLTSREQEVIAIYQGFHQRNKHKVLPIPIFLKSSK